MQREDEVSPTLDTERLLFPELAQPGTCGTCFWARLDRRTHRWRCAKHDVTTKPEDSCADYAPAPPA
jgi:hypothetical protein